MNLSDDASLHGTRDWPHAPPHRLRSAGVYFVTARTVNRAQYFHAPDRLNFVRDRLLSLAAQYGWKLEAWAVMTSHYHFVAHSPEPEHSASSLSKFLRHLHGDVTRFVNRADGVQGRTLWHNYRETHLILQRGYLARLNYTHNNPVHHRLVGRACAMNGARLMPSSTLAHVPGWTRSTVSNSTRLYLTIAMVTD